MTIKEEVNELTATFPNESQDTIAALWFAKQLCQVDPTLKDNPGRLREALIQVADNTDKILPQRI